MKREWTVEEAQKYVAKVQKGKISTGLTYCSAIDFLMNHTNKFIVNKKDENEDDSIRIVN